MPRDRCRARTSTLIGLALILAAGTAAEAAGVADDLLAAGRFREARDVVERRYREDPAEPGVADLLARVRAWTGDYPGAIQLYDTLLTQRPADPEVRVERARVLAWMGRYREAEQAAQNVLVLHPGHDQAWIVLANARLWDGDPEGARCAAEKGMDHAPDSAGLLAWMAASDYRDGRVGDARHRLSRALNLDPALRTPTDPSAYSAFVAESRFVYEDVSPLGPWRETALSLDWRPRGAWTARGEVERIDRFGREEFAIHGTVVRALGRWRLEGALQGTPGAEVLPRWGVAAGASWMVSPRWRLETALHRNRYREGPTTRLDAGAARSWGTVWETAYRVSWTRDVLGATDATHIVTGAWIPSPLATLRLSVFHGSDVTRSSAGAGVTTETTSGLALLGQFPVASGWGLRVSAALTDRGRSYRRQSLGLGVTRRF